MKLVIFGATGTVGRHLVEQAVAAGHTVTAFTRSGRLEPSKNLVVVRGDVLKPSDVDSAVEGQDGVVVALGAGRKGNVRAAGTAHVIAAMQRHGVTRLIVQSTLGAGESRRNLDFFWKHIMFGLLLRPAYRDHQLQEAHVKASGLDWTIVRPGAFTDGPLTGNYRHGFGPERRDITLKVSRADVAHFLLEQIRGKAYLRRAAALSY